MGFTHIAVLDHRPNEEHIIDRPKDYDRWHHHFVRQDAFGMTNARLPDLFGVSRDYYGTPVPLQQLASVQVPEARMLLIKPHDRNSLNPIEKAIRDSDLGVSLESCEKASGSRFPVIR